MDLNIDTHKIRETNSNIKVNISKIESLYREMFERLSNMPLKTGEWVGKSAINYVNALKNEEKEFLNYIEDLQSYSRYLDNVADDYELLARNIRR